MICRQTAEIIDALNSLELGLRELGLWSDNRPDAESLSSTLPFCYDTLEIEQWLQFIFLGRMRELLEQGDDLPEIALFIRTLRCWLVRGKTLIPVWLSWSSRLTRKLRWELVAGRGFEPLTFGL